MIRFCELERYIGISLCQFLSYDDFCSCILCSLLLQQPLSVELGPGILGNIFDGIQVCLRSYIQAKYKRLSIEYRLFNLVIIATGFSCCIISVPVVFNYPSFFICAQMILLLFSYFAYKICA